MAKKQKAYYGLNETAPFRLGKGLLAIGISVLFVAVAISAFPPSRWMLQFLLPLFALFFFLGLLLVIIALFRYVYSKGSEHDGLWALKTGPLR
ncbi:MAG: hypothetical protein EAX95_14390 [Candidatus Thorarchaeota archaeon]|nr:hypothetical protein [Candidatus Thorarchaeota archaeon]